MFSESMSDEQMWVGGGVFQDPTTQVPTASSRLRANGGLSFFRFGSCPYRKLVRDAKTADSAGDDSPEIFVLPVPLTPGCSCYPPSVGVVHHSGALPTRRQRRRTLATHGLRGKNGGGRRRGSTARGSRGVVGEAPLHR